MTAVAVRSARLEDAEQLARLFDHLGHPQTGDALRGRLEGVLADPRADVLVADDGGSLVGAATYFLVPVAHDSRPWCRDATCSRIEATSALHRTGAHRFYDELGYSRTSAHFLKRF
jgi:hypothetical protein